MVIETRLVTENIFVENIGVRRIEQVLFTGGVSLLDQIIGSKVGAGTIQAKVSSDTLVVTDGVVLARHRFRLSGEALTVADQYIRQYIKARGTTDTVQIFDDGSIQRYVSVVFTEGQVALIDALIKVVAGNNVIIRTVGDSILVTDSRTAVMIKRRVITDALAMNDPITGTRTLDVLAGETFDVTDNYLRRLLRRKVSSDGVTLLDFFTADVTRESGGLTLTRTVSDPIVFTDEILKGILRLRQPLETIALTDDFIARVAGGHFKNIVDGVILTDGVLATKKIERESFDSLNVSDSFIKELFSHLAYDVRIVLSSSDGTDFDYDGIELGVGN